MKLNQIFTEKKKEPSLQIYCDLDGVLANFKKKAIEATGIDPDDASKKDEFWKELRSYSNKGHKIWKDLELLPDAMELWNFIKPFNPIICTASGGFPNAEKEKRAWVSEHLGNPKVIVVTHSKDKSEHADEQSILIDDLSKSIDPWKSKGGIGILHKSAAGTIKELKKIGF